LLSEEQAGLPTVDIPKKLSPKKRQAKKEDKVAANKKAKGVGPAAESENKSNGPGKEPKKPPAKKKAAAKDSQLNLVLHLATLMMILSMG
jgi:hypothetical protein